MKNYVKNYVEKVCNCVDDGHLLCDEMNKLFEKHHLAGIPGCPASPAAPHPPGPPQAFLAANSRIRATSPPAAAHADILQLLQLRPIRAPFPAAGYLIGIVCWPCTINNCTIPNKTQQSQPQIVSMFPIQTKYSLCPL